MSIAQAASAAATTFPFVNVVTPYGTYALPVVMTAIGGAETGGTFDPAAAGDYGLGGPSCNGYTSWGLWQIHNVHASYLEGVTGSSDPCQWASWLSVPANCARAALAIYQSQGLGAWTTWQEGTYSAWLTPALAAVTAAVGGSPASGSATVYTTAPSPWPWLIGGGLVLAGGALALRRRR